MCRSIAATCSACRFFKWPATPSSSTRSIGAGTGLGFYTYLTARLFPAVLLLIIGILLITKRPVPWRGLGWALAGSVVIMLPLFNLWLTQPELLGGRTGQVSILNPLINQGDSWHIFPKRLGSIDPLLYKRRHDCAPQCPWPPIVRLGDGDSVFSRSCMDGAQLD